MQYHWWQKGIVYQIYPRSYQDSNGDGIGDLPGIVQRLDYVKSLNVDAIWLSPIYPSPMHDFGYDVADYKDIHPIFGTMDDFEHLLDEMHRRGLKLLIDLVPNHTSDEHPWFVESRSSRDNPKRDWYIWRDPAPDGGPPNNWISSFGGSVWEFDQTTGQYYMHQFDVHQPDLNYRHPQVLPAMLDVMRFWLDKGVDGFRVDVIYRMLKDDRFLDAPPNPDWDGTGPPLRGLKQIYTSNLPGVHDIIRQMRAVIDEYDERVMVGEVYLPLEDLVQYYGRDLDECHLPFNFKLITLDWGPQAIRQAVNDYEAHLPPGAWPNWVTGNHDQPRIATRVGPAQARVAGMLLLTLRGTPTVYYGEELGMENGVIPPEKVQDPQGVNLGAALTRDVCRTPMQWDAGPNAGFCPSDVEPWLPVPADYATRNVAAQEDVSTSMLSLYRALTALRCAEPALSAGDYVPVDAGVDDVVAYVRTVEGADRFLVVLNFGDRAHTLDLSEVAPEGTIAVCTDMVRQGSVDLASLALNPDEGLVMRCLS